MEFHPDEEPVKGVLRRWLEVNGLEHMAWVADAVEQANEKPQLKQDRHAAIGPSYFMKDGLDEAAVERIWKHSVLPYIEERLFVEREGTWRVPSGCPAPVSRQRRPGGPERLWWGQR